jgi:hypothetical protein
MTRGAWSILLLLGAAGCGASDEDPPGPDADGDADADSDADADADSDADADADPFDDCGAFLPVNEEPEIAGCIVPDVDCPVEHPHPGAPCSGELACEYGADETEDLWRYECYEGQWSAWSDWEEVPPLAEICLDPFEGVIGGAIDIGPLNANEAFRPFDDCEVADLIWGGQGSAMLAYRLRVRDVESPACVLVTTTIDPTGGGETQQSNSRVAVHCNESLAVYVPLEVSDCGTHDLGLQIHVAVEGIGETSARVIMQRAECCNDCDG